MVVVSLTRLPQCSTKRRSRTLSLRWEINKNLGVLSSKSGIAVFSGLATAKQNDQHPIWNSGMGVHFARQLSSEQQPGLAGLPVDAWWTPFHTLGWSFIFQLLVVSLLTTVASGSNWLYLSNPIVYQQMDWWLIKNLQVNRTEQWVLFYPNSDSYRSV